VSDGFSGGLMFARQHRSRSNSELVRYFKLDAHHTQLELRCFGIIDGTCGGGYTYSSNLWG
jgi:hypothetical protein